MGLGRFLEAQAGVYQAALAELRAGVKRSHWMWFIFPQLRGLGQSTISQHYGIVSLSEARAFLDHPVLGKRYVECVETMQALATSDPVAVFGSVDALKLRSSLTLFEKVGRLDLLGDALERWFDGDRDEATLNRLR
ncbi:calpastatin [Sphingobium yanoikuyae]|uniref:Calpastatin n=2 Tax=Sphingobium yanoikuyae TaxID=13690 RepID=A0A291N743_SPHYA|nr:calpastatin [Sphingobium yanoikuyae]